MLFKVFNKNFNQARLSFRWQSLLVSVFTLLTLVWAQQPVKAQSNLDLWSDPYSENRVGFIAIKGTGLGTRDPRVIIAGVVQVLLGFLGVLAVVLMIYAGILWMTANGNEAKIAKAKKILRDAAIGLLIILSAFAIAIFILRSWLGVTDGGKGVLNDDGKNGGVSSGIGALGSGIVKSVYPAPNQTNIARNVAIIVTFKEAVKPDTICDKVENGKCALGAKAIDKNLFLYKSEDTEKKATALYASSADNLTFVFRPVEYLGSASQSFWYAMTLTTNIKKLNGQDAFGLGEFVWRFEVNSNLDLEPPKILNAQLFPAVDNERDTIGNTTPAVAAQGLITVKAQPRAAQGNRLTYTKTNQASADLSVSNPDSNNCDGTLLVAINNTSPLTASLDYQNVAGKADVSNAAIVDNQIETSCGFKLSLAAGLAAGHSWRLDLTSERAANWLSVAGVRYEFVNGTAGNGQISLGSDLAQTATNIQKALASNGKVIAKVNGSSVTLTAAVPGIGSNRLDLSSDAQGSVLKLDKFSGGKDQQNIIDVKGAKDQPKNAIIQINFNEAINPVSVSGNSQALNNRLRVINVDNGQTVEGNFIPSNNYQTVEFVPSNQCGTNGCGEPVYCLPAGANLRVELLAAGLAASCTASADCVSRAPFTECRQSLCTETQSGAFYPEGAVDNGITDLANNSLDGNGDGRAVGPKTFYSLNQPNNQNGDNFSWSFFVNDEMDISAPQIISVDPANAKTGVNLIAPVSVLFDKLMLSASLSSGSVVVKKDNQEIRHQLINLWAVDKSPVGYWVTKTDVDASQPADNIADRTVALIEHTSFADNLLYRSQVGSGVKDIYQNCFKPCAGVGCNPGGENSSCCLGLPANTANSGQCQ